MEYPFEGKKGKNRYILHFDWKTDQYKQTNKQTNKETKKETKKAKKKDRNKQTNK